MTRLALALIVVLGAGCSSLPEPPAPEAAGWPTDVGWVTDFAAGPRGTLYASRDWAVERLAFRGGELLGLSQPSGLLRVPRAD